jgi:hypothetical protein
MRREKRTGKQGPDHHNLDICRRTWYTQLQRSSSTAAGCLPLHPRADKSARLPSRCIGVSSTCSLTAGRLEEEDRVRGSLYPSSLHRAIRGPMPEQLLTWREAESYCRWLLSLCGIDWGVTMKWAARNQQSVESTDRPRDTPHQFASLKVVDIQGSSTAIQRISHREWV